MISQSPSICQWVAAGMAIAAIHAGAAHASDNPAEVPELPTVVVVGTTPLPGLGLPLREVPGNVQTFGGGQLNRQRPATLTQFLDDNAGSVQAASGQGSPFQQSV